MAATSGVAHVNLVKASKVLLLQEAEDEIEQTRNDGSEEMLARDELHLLSMLASRNRCEWLWKEKVVYLSCTCLDDLAPQPWPGMRSHAHADAGMGLPTTVRTGTRLTSMPYHTIQSIRRR